MKALTVQQPWAWAIIHGGKDVENRTTAWSYRGPLAIHAGMRVSERGFQAIDRIHGTAIPPWPHGHESEVYGAIIGVVDLVDAHPASPGCCESPWAETSYVEHGGKTRHNLVHLVLERPRIIMAPVPCTGRLGLWDVPRDVLLDIQAELSPANGGPA